MTNMVVRGSYINSTNMTDDYTVLTDWSGTDEKSHREIAEELLPKLREEMPEEEYRLNFGSDLRRAVTDSIAQDLGANLKTMDWHEHGFEEPEDILNAKDVSKAIAREAEQYFEDDQTGKPSAVFRVIIKYAEEYNVDVGHQ